MADEGIPPKIFMLIIAVIVVAILALFIGTALSG